MDRSAIELDRLHTTPMGAERIRRNLGLTKHADVVEYCRNLILATSARMECKGKNIYILSDGQTLTIHARSMTIITAHRVYS